LFAQERSKPELPGPYCLVRDLVASLKEQFGDVAEPELVAQPPEDRQQDDIGGELEIVVGRTGTFVEATVARPTLEPVVAQGGTMLPFAGCRRSAMRAVHG
jgi:hypothetical protein